MTVKRRVSAASSVIALKNVITAYYVACILEGIDEKLIGSL